MEVGDALDRRGRAERGRAGLLERETVLRSIELVLAEARLGVGHALLIEGHPGMGKTRLHEAALDLARGDGMLVLRAAGAELEREIVFGVAVQLVNAALAELSPERRAAVLETATPPLRRLLGLSDAAAAPAPDSRLALLQALFGLLVEAVDNRPSLVAIDDLQWADTSSLEFLLYLLQRLDELPAAVIMTRRHGLPGVEPDTFDRIAVHPRAWVHSLGPLGSEPVRQLAREALGERVDEPLVSAIFESTGGNPFLLRELLTSLREEIKLTNDQLAEHARSLAPDAVTRIVRVRLGRLGGEAAALAGAVATLGDDVPLRQAAALASLTVEQGTRAADRLAATDVLLAREPLRFVHPLVRHAVAADIPASARASRHLEAARLLHSEGAAPEHVAAHLLVGRAQGDDWVVEQLWAAAREAAAQGAPSSALQYLERALQEPPAPELQAEILAEIGLAKDALGLEEAADDLAAAAISVADEVRRAELELERGRILHSRGRNEEASAAFEAGIAAVQDAGAAPGQFELLDQLYAGYIASATVVPTLQARALELAERLITEVPATPRSQGQRLLLAQAALQAAYVGEPAGVVCELAERAWDAGRVLEQAASQWLGWRLVCAAFIAAGAFERAAAVAGEAIADATRRNAPLSIATATFMRGLPRLLMGEVDGALADLELVVAARADGWGYFARTAAAHLALCMIEKGDLARAHDLLLLDGAPQELNDLEDAMRLYALAELRLAQGQGREALEAALAAGALAELRTEFVSVCPWRGVAAESALAVGDHERALILAREAHSRGERTQILHLRIRGRRVLGMCLGGEEGLEHLREAVALAERGPLRLETIRAQIVLGATLRRRNARMEARVQLTRAADTARTCGASALEELARTELAASGARPRRDALLSGLESLTASERRIAELAAEGQSNRDIAQALFVTPKTVEYHLRNVFRKLEIKNRRELPDALG